MILLNKAEVIKVLLAKFPGFDPEFDIDFEATEVTNKAQLKKVAEQLEETYDNAPLGKKLGTLERFMIDLKREVED